VMINYRHFLRNGGSGPSFAGSITREVTRVRSMRLQFHQ
jgi:hypothetical protein